MIILFPIELPENWQTAEDNELLALQKGIQHWVCAESSLTVKVKELGVSFSVEVINQCYKSLSITTKKILNTSDNVALIREVVLKQGDTPLIYAQTVMPESTIIGTEARLAELGNQSLGQILFQSHHATRGKIEISLVEKASPLGSYIEQHLNQPIIEPCFIRRSIFHLNDKPLLVNECFLPALIINLED